MEVNFNDIYWHDSIVKCIKIDRAVPENNDTIEFEIDWYEKGKRSTFFEDVYWTNLNLNFGIIAGENILDAFIAEKTDEDVMFFRSKWKGTIDINEINCYVIDLNTTGGRIKIIAKAFKIS